MTEEDKKRQELALVEGFIASWTFDRLMVVSQPSPPDPDIICRLGSVEIGVEITRLYQERPAKREGRASPATPQERESSRKSLERELETVSAEFNLPYGHYSAMLEGQVLVDKKARRQVALRVVEFVKSIAASGRSTEVGYLDLPEALRELGIDQIKISPLDVEIRDWTLPEARFTPSLTPSLIEEAIAAKEGKLSRYQRSGRPVWLLMIAGVDGLSSEFLFPASLFGTPFPCRFDRVFIFDARRRLAREVPLTGR